MKLRVFFKKEFKDGYFIVWNNIFLYRKIK